MALMIIYSNAQKDMNVQEKPVLSKSLKNIVVLWCMKLCKYCDIVALFGHIFVSDGDIFILSH